MSAAVETERWLDEVPEVLQRRYRFVRELGRGRLGPVYLAYRRWGKRPLAIRVRSPALAADPEKRDR